MASFLNVIPSSLQNVSLLYNISSVNISNNCSDLLIEGIEDIRNIYFNLTLLSNAWKTIAVDAELETNTDLITYPSLPTCITPSFYCNTSVKLEYCNQDLEKKWLTDFYDSTNGDYWTDNTNWNSRFIPYCYWYGIECCKLNNDDNNYCINILYLGKNNLTGTLPSYWPNSSVLTIIDFDTNYIAGTLPDYQYNLPNLAIFDIDDTLFSGTLPIMPYSNCSLGWYLTKTKIYGTLPDMSTQIYMIGLYIGSGSYNRPFDIEKPCLIEGTLPNWNDWLLPHLIHLQLCYFSGTLPSFNNAYCPYLSVFRLNGNLLEGTISNLASFALTNVEITLANNNLFGSFPWTSLSRIGQLDISNNSFDGILSLDFGSYQLESFNISVNSFTGAFPCFNVNKTKNLIFVDFRYNEFDSIDECIDGWPSSIQYFLGSNNKILDNFNKVTKGLSNLSILSLSVNSLKGTISTEPIEADFYGRFLDLYDNDLSCQLPYALDRKFNQSWIYIGQDLELPFPSYASSQEKQLLMAIVPGNEVYEYLIIPSIIGCCGLLIYCGIYFKYIRIKLQRRYQTKETNKLEWKYLDLVSGALKFLVILCIWSIFAMVNYILGSDFISCGYVSLQMSCTYLGSQTITKFNVYSHLSLILYAIYLFICIYFTVFLIKKSSNINKSTNVIGLDQHLLSSNSSTIAMIDMKPNANINHNKTDIDIEFGVKSDNNNVCIDILLFSVFIIVVLFSFCISLFPLILYTIYHSLPTNTTLSVLNSIPIELIKHGVPILLSLQKWFLFPYMINHILLPILPKYFRNYLRNGLIQFYRFISMILCPLFILLIFDNGCYQHWKSLWPYCVEGYDEYLNSECYALDSLHTIYNTFIWICTSICQKHFVSYRCIRRLFEVLGPLYIIKMNIAILLPLIYGFKQKSFRYKSFVQSVKSIIKCKCCKNNQNDVAMDASDDSDLASNKSGLYLTKIKMELEYIGLISSLEIVIVFGFFIPFLIILYTVMMFGYYVVYSYFFYYKTNIVQIQFESSFKVIAKWLIGSILIQQILSILFYFSTQSFIHGYFCLFICIGSWIFLAFLVK